MKYPHKAINYTTGETIEAKHKDVVIDVIIGEWEPYNMIKVMDYSKNVYTGYVKDFKK